MGRRLTAEEAHQYFANNYEASIVEKRAKARNLLIRYPEINYNKLKDTVAYNINYDRNKAVINDENGNAVVVKDYENPVAEEIIADEIDLENEIQDNTILDATDELENVITEEEEKTTFENGASNIENSSKLKRILTTAHRIHYLDRNDSIKVTAGIDNAISDVAENPKEFAQKFSADKIDELSNRKLSRFDTVGRIMSDDVLQRFKNTFLKDENGRIVPLFLLKTKGTGGFKHSKLGLVAGTLESVNQQYSLLNEESIDGKLATVQEVIVNMTNPLVLDYTPYELSINGLHDLVDRGILTFKEFVRYTNYKKNLTGYYSEIPTKIRERLRRAGYDGIVFYNNTTDSGSVSVVVFDESQMLVVAENGVLVNGNGISETEITSDELNDTSSSVENTIKIAMIVTERKYSHTSTRRIMPSEKIAAGSSGFLENGALDSNDAYASLKRNIENNLNTNLSGKDTANRILSDDMIDEFNKTAFKDKDGNLLSFFAHDSYKINLKKSTDMRMPFTALNSAIDELRAKKNASSHARHGVIQEFYINAINPVIIKSDEYDLAKIANQIFIDGKITKDEYTRMCMKERSMKTLVERCLKRNNYDSVILMKNNGECAVIPFDESQIVLVATNGILENNASITPGDKQRYDVKIHNLKSVVIDENRQSVIKVDAIDDILNKDVSNTTKLKMLTKVVMCSNNSEIDYDTEYLAGSSGVLEKGDLNVWRVRNVIKTLINRDVSNIVIAKQDTAGRSLSQYQRELLKGSIFIDDNGRPYSVFATNPHGDNRLLRGSLGFRLGTLDAAHEKYWAEKIKFARHNLVKYEEYYLTVKKTCFLMFDPEGATPGEIAKQLLNEGILTQIEYQQILVRDIKQKTEYSNIAKSALFKLLKKKGFDSLAFMSDRFDAGSIGLVVLDGNKLMPVAVDGLPVENSDRTLADSNEPAFFMPENEGENFENENVEKSQLGSVENDDENGIIKEKLDNDTGVPGEYTYEIVWSIHNHLLVRKCGKGCFGKRIEQSDLRVDNYELKINSNNESYYLQHPDGRYVQFENMKDSTLQDAKLVKSERSYYHVDRLSSCMKQKLHNKAKRQLETANAAGYKLEWIVSDITAVEQLRRFFAEQNMDIIVTYCPE